MTIATVSSKGQITLPSAVRRRLCIKPKSRVDVEVRGDEIVIRPAKSIRDVAGALANYAKGKPSDWETVRSEMERLVAEEVAHESPQRHPD